MMLNGNFIIFINKYLLSTFIPKRLISILQPLEFSIINLFKNA